MEYLENVLEHICEAPFFWATLEGCCDSPWRGFSNNPNSICDGTELLPTDPEECCGGNFQEEQKCAENERICITQGNYDVKYCLSFTI